MSAQRVFLATTGQSVTRAEQVNSNWHVTESLLETGINCLGSSPQRSGVVYAGTQTRGVMISKDGGRSWEPCGLQNISVKSLAVHPHDPKTIYAGCKPLSLYVTRDGGASWEELPDLRKKRRWWWFSPADPPDMRPYVQALAISPSNPNIIMAGMEIGGVLRSEDGGQTWSRNLRGAVLDCHSLAFHHSNGNWVYEGGGGGAAVSQDEGRTWRKPKDGLTKTYGWMVAADPARPEVWYISAGDMPNPLRGEFTPPAHKDGNARASIYRSVGGAAWELLSGGLPKPLDYMAYGLITDSQVSGHVYAGLSNGEVWHSEDYGDTWSKLPFQFSGIHRTMIMLDPGA